MSSFWHTFNFDQRLTESKRMKEKYDKYLPVIIKLVRNPYLQDNLPYLKERKYLLNKRLKMRELADFLRKKLGLASEVNLNISINGVTLRGDTIWDSNIEDYYQTDGYQDGFLYIHYY